MSLLSVTVKKARFVGVQAQQFNTYVTLKLQNVKSTTVTVKGANPCWEQDFLFETNDVNTGLLVEVWSKGMLWDRALGYHYIPLPGVSYASEVTKVNESGENQQQQQQQQPQGRNAEFSGSTLPQPQLQSNTTLKSLDTVKDFNISRDELNLQASPQLLENQTYEPDTFNDTNSNTQEYVFTDTDDSGQWVSLDSELEMLGGEVVGTKAPTGHTLLITCRFELPFDPENTEAADLQRKLEMLNNTMDQEARAEQARRQLLYNTGHSAHSEDSDYTSDLNYPVCGQGANSSASQFRTAANQLATPQRSLETSRENSYERDDHQIPATVGGRLAAGSYGYTGRGHSPRYDEPYPGEGPPQRYSTQQSAESSEPLFYNSRPRHYKEYRRRKHTWDYEDSQDGWYSEGYDYQSTRVDETRIYSDTEYYPSTTTSTSSRRRGPHRRPSLERQTTLYDEQIHYGTDGYGSDSRVGRMSATYPECHTDIRHSEYYDSITGYVYQDERYGQDDEDRQWDSGGKWYLGSSTYNENKRNRKTLPQRPASSIGIHRPEYRPIVTRQRSYESEELDYSGHSTRRRKALEPQQRPVSRQEGGTGKKLPPTPTKPSSVIIGRKPVSLPATPGRQLPRTRTPSEESYYKQDYNEDYNYAYRSSQDNLPQETSYVDGSVYVDPTVPSEPIVQQRAYVGGAKDTNYGSPVTVRVQDNQFIPDTYGSSQVDELYGQQESYQDTERTRETYDPNQGYLDNSYSDEYNQQSYVPPTSQVYQDTYQTNTYPKSSETLEHYDNSRGTVIDDNYQSTVGYNQNMVDYSQEPYKQDPYRDTYKQDSYQETYKQDSYQETYKQDSYQESFTDSYKQDSFPDSFKQDSFPESYKQDSYADSYKQDSYKSTYKQDSFPESFPDSYKQDSYQEPYKQDNSQYNGYETTVATSVYDQNVSTSIYDRNVPTSVYDENVPTSVYDQQYPQQQYDNKYNVTTSGYEEPYQDTHGQTSVPASKDSSYQEPYREQKQPALVQQRNNYQEYHVSQYGKEEDGTDYAKKYEEENYHDYPEQYGDEMYQESYQDSYEEQYKSSAPSSNDRRQSEVPELSVTTPRGQTRTNGYQSSESEYFYPSQDEQEVSALGSSRRKKLTAKRDVSPLLQQNTDSLESRDDELKDSFDTAVSSVGSSQPRKGFSEYSTAGESSPVPGTLVDSPQSTTQTTAAMSNHVTSNNRVTTTAMVHGGTPIVNGKRPLERTDSYQEEVIDDEEYPEIVPKEPHRKDSQLSHQSQLSQHSTHSQKPKLIRGDSYASDNYNEDSYAPDERRHSSIQSFRKDSYSSLNQDNGFKPPLNRTDSYQKRDIARRGSYGQNFTAPQPISRAESCQRGYFKDQDSIDETDIVLSSVINGEYKMRDETLERYERGEEALNRGSRENSLVEPYKGTPPLSRSDSPRGSLTKQASLDESVQMDTPPRSPPEPPPDEELLELVGVAPVPTQLKERTEMTAKQRWHWAYNKIIMQLNVSVSNYPFSM